MSLKYAKSRADLARALGISLPTLREWVARGAPRRSKMGYSIEATRRWREENLGPAHRTRVSASAEASSDTLTDKQRLEKAQADQREALAALADLKLKLERGELRPLREIEAWDRARASVVKRGLLSLGRSVAPALLGVQDIQHIEGIITKRARELLERFARI